MSDLASYVILAILAFLVVSVVADEIDCTTGKRRQGHQPSHVRVLTFYDQDAEIDAEVAEFVRELDVLSGAASAEHRRLGLDWNPGRAGI